MRYRWQNLWLWLDQTNGWCTNHGQVYAFDEFPNHPSIFHSQCIFPEWKSAHYPWAYPQQPRKNRQWQIKPFRHTTNGTVQLDSSVYFAVNILKTHLFVTYGQCSDLSTLCKIGQLIDNHFTIDVCFLLNFRIKLKCKKIIEVAWSRIIWNEWESVLNI